jgi:phosphoglycerol transferase MdoB-like AlkP superfamily enzyme
VLNSSFTFLQTIKRQSLPRDQYFSNKEMLKWIKSGYANQSLLEGHRPQGQPNIVLIILESFALEYWGRPHHGKGYTPFLDELSKDSIFFNNAFANARRSIEGVGAIMGGIPALMNEPFISSQYLTNYFLGIGTWLQKKNYHTSFFHGAQNGTMYFDQFMKSAGVQHYYGLNEFPDPSLTDGTWGIWDEPFLQWMNGKLSTFPQPFFTTVFTLSSHNPFKIPAEYQGKFPKGDLDIHETIGYTDYSLRKFFESARKEPWFKNTIFIITADHTYKSSRPGYDNELGPFRIPLMIYSPGFQLPKVDENEVVQHADILPTILDLLGIEEKEKNYLGTSVFVPGDRFAVSYTDGKYLFVTKGYYLTHTRSAGFEINPSDATPEKKTELENRLKAVIQYFSQGMWDNKLYYPSGR